VSVPIDPGWASGLEPDWRRLAELRGNAFLTPEWARCWLDQYGDGLSSFVPDVRAADGALTGLFALTLPERGRPRTCRIAGANLGDRFHPLAVPGSEAEVGAAVGEALADARSAWSMVALDRVDLEGGWLEALRDGLGVRVRTLARPATALPLIRMDRHGDWEAYLASRSSHLRKRLRWLERRVAKDHQVAIRRTERPEELAADMATLFDLHDRRWSGRGGSSLASRRARAFHAEFAAAALGRGWLRLWLMEWDGEPVAAWYGWRVGDRYSFYNGGFDPERSKLSPGMVMLATVIRSAFEEGAREFDFLLGDEAYKARFADEGAETEVADVVLARSLPHPAATVTLAAHAARRAGRALPREWRTRLGARLRKR